MTNSKQDCFVELKKIILTLNSLNYFPIIVVAEEMKQVYVIIKLKLINT